MSLAVRVIPCLDVDAGRVVKGVNFVDLRDAGDPVEMARVYDAEGADELTFLDITASSGDRATTYDMVSRTAESVFIPLTVGGGVRSADDVRALLRAGADKVSVNTAAIARPELLRELAEIFGSQCIVLSLDARRTAQRQDWAPSGVTWHSEPSGAGWVPLLTDFSTYWPKTTTVADSWESSTCCTPTSSTSYRVVADTCS